MRCEHLTYPGPNLATTEHSPISCEYVRDIVHGKASAPNDVVLATLIPQNGLQAAVSPIRQTLIDIDVSFVE